VRILLIEDTPELAELIDIVLSANGHTVETAADGPRGVAQAWRQPPDLCLVDVQLPCIDGYEVLRRLREQPHLAGRPIIAITALATSSDRARLLRAGFTGYIPKPIRVRDLSKQVTEYLHGAEIPDSSGTYPPRWRTTQ
jgi:two-component system, cell cycle response regulator